MNKIKNATKRITAVGASALMVSSAAFGAGLSDYPSNFVEDGEFMGSVVVGSTAAAIDSTSAASIIDDLASEFSGDNEKVEISYSMSASGGDSRDITRSSVELNYGETVDSVTESLDDSDMDILEDGTFNNGLEDEDFDQELLFTNGTFNHALRDEVDGVTEISDNIFYDAQDVFAVYTLELDSAIDLSTPSTQSDLEDDFIGEEITIMGNQFTIAEISRDSQDLDELTLIGGANKVALGEGESTTVTVDGESYDIEVLNVDTESSTSKVLLTVNGQSKSIDEFDTEEISGVNIAVTDLVGSGRDSVKGYAEIVVGGQKVTLKDNGAEVEVNEEDVSDVHESYIVESDFNDGGTGMQTITISYKVDDDTALEAGDSLMDVLFQGFELVFEGTNNPDFSEIEIRGGSNEITVQGTLESGESFNRDMYEYDTDNAANGNLYLRGKSDEDHLFTSTSTNLNATDVTLPAGISLTGTSVTFNTSITGVIGSGVLLFDDNENQYLYQIESIDVNDNEVDLEELIEGSDETALAPNEWATDLEVTLAGTSNSGANITIPFTSLGNIIAFENEMLLEIDNSFTDSLTTGGVPLLTFKLDSSDVDGDSLAEESDEVVINASYDTTDDEVDVKIFTVDNPDFVNTNDADVVDDSSDIKKYVTTYGIIVEYDNDESQTISIMVPEEQVRANLMVYSGGSGSTSGSVTVDADAADDKRAELEDMGYTITGTSTVSSEEVEFDVTSPMMDTEMVAMGEDAWVDMIVVGGPAVNQVAAVLLGLDFPTVGAASGVGPDEAVVRYFEDANSVLVYGYDGDDTAAAADELNEGGLTGNLVNVN